MLVYPQGADPSAILKDSPQQIAYAVGASSGESSAKAAVVKNWWWEANQGKFPELAMYPIPGVSENGNPDNVLTASKAVSAADQAKLSAAAIARKDAFGAPQMAPFDKSRLAFPLALMEKGQIDPQAYSW